MMAAAEILNAKILIVDDQQANVALLQQVLRDAGYLRVESTVDPHAVYTMHRNNHYDLILLDLQMPGLDGFQVMEKLKEIDVDDYLPILVITAQPGHKLRALACGAKDFISKPFDLVEAKTRIHNMLEVRLLYRKLQNYNEALEKAVRERTEELQESEARFRRLSELASDWYWEQDENGRFTRVYGPAQEMLGTSVDSMLGEKKDVQGVLWNEGERATLEANIAARRPFLDLICSRTIANGAHEIYHVSGEPMFDSSGRFKGYRGVGRDVTKILCESHSS